jgi:hypothetical protein
MMIEKRSGTSRGGRLVSALNPENSLVDNRSLIDLLSYSREVADLINFYGNDNEIQGTWVQFFRKNSTFFLAEIVNEDLDSLYDKGNDYLIKFHLSQNENQNIGTEYLLGLSKLINLFFELADRWQRRLDEVSSYGENLGLQSGIKNIQKFHVSDGKGLIEEAEAFLKEVPNLTSVETEQEDETTENILLELELRLQDLYSKLKDTFNLVYQQLESLQQTAQRELNIYLTEKSDHEPLMGLLIAFLKTFRFQQDHLNSFTSRHLDYYYHEVLEQKNEAAVPDSTHVSFTLNQETSPYFLPKGTRLLADVNEEGLESHYETLNDTWVSGAEIKSLQTLFISRNPDINFGSSYNLVSNIYYAPIANSKDGVGAPFVEMDKSWPIVGEDQSVLSERQKTMVVGEVGMAISAPVLYLEAGVRKINLGIKVDKSTLKDLYVLLEDIASNDQVKVANIYDNLLRNSIEIYGTTTDGWFKIEEYAGQLKESSIDMEITLGKEMPPLVPLSEETEVDSFPVKWPVIKILLRSGSSIYAYSFLHSLKMREINIGVEVKSLQKLVLTNVAGDFNNNKPFPLFGAIPDKDSEILIGNREVFLKNVEKLEVDIEWNNLPDLEGGFERYYNAYQNEKGEPLNINNDSFKMKISALSHSQFFPEEKENQQSLTLFQMDGERLSSITRFRNIEVEKLHLVSHCDEPIELQPYANDTQLGYLRLAMEEPKFAFGHTLFPSILAEAIKHNTFATTQKTWWKRGKKFNLVPLPKEPYTPLVKRVSLNYTAKSTIHIVGQGRESQADEHESQIFHLTPLGYQAIFKNGISYGRQFLESYGSDGYLIIGLDNIKPGLPLNLMFDFSIEGNKTLETPISIRWFYLADNNYIQFKKEDFYYDTTFSFTTSGIVSLRIPEDINKNNTILPGDHYWLLVAARGNVKNVLGRALQIKPHAVKVRWVDNGDPDHYAFLSNLPKIKSLVEAQPSITSVEQVGPFFGGHPKESESLLWARVSERLRHKGRAINIWDYERLVIQKFPEIRQVKCIGPYEVNETLEPGKVVVVVVTEHMSKQNLRPTAGINLLGNIQTYLKGLASEHVDLSVINPAYEWLKLSMKVILKPQMQNETGKYLSRLYQDIEDFICPWLLEGNIRIGGGFKKKDLFNFLNSRPYIDYLTSFSVVHVFEKKKQGTNDASILMETKYEFDLLDSANPKDQRDEIIASSPWGILVPAQVHSIDFLNEVQFIKPQKVSIDRMSLETDFVILDPTEEEKKRIQENSSETDYFSILDLD